VIEKLLENWLDSASERSYQAVFVQMLAAQGYRVVHSTRHTALEYGKDVLAIAPDGIGCAFQLKGHPGGKLGLAQFRDEIQSQLVQLMSQSVIFPGFPDGIHRSFLVSNGYFEEEVQRAIDDLNRNPYPSKVSLISRGDLLVWAKDLGTSLWPSELTDSRLLLELYLADPKDILPVPKLAQLIGKILAIDSEGAKFSSKAAFHRAATSAALLTGIACSSFGEVENHFAIVSAWVLFSIMIIAAGEKHQYRIEKAALETIKLAEGAVADALSRLLNEVLERKYLVEGDPFVDLEVRGWRYTITLGLLSCLAFLDEVNACLVEELRIELHKWLMQRHHNVILWGEAAVASLVPWLIWLRKHNATIFPDFEIFNLTKAVIVRNQSKSLIPLVSPYYSFEEIGRFNLRTDAGDSMNTVGGETFSGSTFTAEPLMHLLTRTNLKQHCKALWSDFTRIAHRVCLPDQKWEYCTLRLKFGVDQTKLYPSTYNWSDLKTEAIEEGNASIPEELARKPWLLALWWQVAPYRYTTDASKIFVDGVFPGWGKW
jgi:hypothetical protein